MAARRRKSRKTARRKQPAARKRARPKRKPIRRARPKPKPARTGRARVQPRRVARPERPRAPASHDRRLVAGSALEVGVVLHYYPRAGAAVVELSRPIHRGDQIYVRGHTTDFVQAVTGLALDGAAVAAGAPPQQVGLRLEQRARAGDRVYRVSW